MRRAATAVVLAVSVLPATAFAFQTATLSVKTRTVYYRISGSTESELRSSLDRHPNVVYPSGEPPVRFRSGEDAYARWLINWTYRYRQSSSGCRLTAIEVSDRVTFVLPKWQPLPNTSSALRAKWNAYMRHLRVHENGHRQNSITAVKGIERDFRGLSSFSSCSSAGATANRLAYQRLVEANKADIAYDARTRHGATQDAVFP
jgi:predicted secreted Zn-dependent protease